MATGVGSLEWARRTHGRLSARDRAELIAQGVRRQARSMIPRLGSRAAAALDVDGYRPPDTAVAREAEERCREASSPAIEAHCYRTHLWGVVIGREEGVGCDEEVLYVASLTHDLGLTEAYRGHDPEAACFALDSASACGELIDRHSWDRERSAAAREAITLHLNAHVAPSDGPEAYLLQLGAALDVTGYRFGDVERATRAAVLAKHPRQGMKDEFKRLMDEELVRHPDSRPAFFTKRLGFKRMIERAPFDE
jgi:predicted HD phosphohydrolase